MKLRPLSCLHNPGTPDSSGSAPGWNSISRMNPAFRTRGGFTMVEIAICLAIIGFALVAIIGVLPSAMRVQKDNREETIINQDAAFWLEAIRGGAKGTDMLTNYVKYMVVSSSPLNAKLVPGTANTTVYVNPQVSSGILAPTGTAPTVKLNSGLQIVGLLSTPRYETLAGGNYRSNYVVAYARAISGPAIDKGANASSRDFAFHYRLVPEVVPAGWTALQNFNWNVQGLGSQQRQELTNQWKVLRTTAGNLHEVRLLFRWPVLAGKEPDEPNFPRIGSGRQVFRTMVSGSLDPLVIAQSGTNYFFNSTVYREVNSP